MKIHNRIMAKKTAVEFYKKLVKLESRCQKLNYMILVCDDNAEAHTLFSDMLIAFGFNNITTCQNAQEAIDLMSVNDYHLVLSDLNMGGGELNGTAIFKYIQEHYTIESAPSFVLISGEGVYKLNDLTNVDITYIEKPFTASQFLSLVLEQYQLHLEKRIAIYSDVEYNIEEALGE